jgi:hypothetical protein
MVGEGAVAGEKFDAAGLAAADAPSEGGGLLGSTIDVMSEATAALSGEGELTAVFVDYVFSQPGAQDETIRRSVLDLIGPAARASHQDGLLLPGDWQPDDSQRRERALALTERIEIVPQIAAFDPALRSAMLVEALRSVLAALQPNSNAGAVSPLPGAASVLAILRRDWNPLAEELFIDRINLLTAHHRLVGLDPTTAWSVELGLDIVRNDVAPAPWTTFQPALLRLQQGVVDTNAEAAVLRSTAMASNAGLAYSADLASGASWLIVASIEQLPEGIPGDTAAMIRDALSAGDLAIVPPGMLETGGMPWWRIDASTGAALGIGPRGWGENIAEYPNLKIPDLGYNYVDIPEFLVVVAVIFICEIFDTYNTLTTVDDELVSNYLVCARIPN